MSVASKIAKPVLVLGILTFSIGMLFYDTKDVSKLEVGSKQWFEKLEVEKFEKNLEYPTARS